MKRSLLTLAGMSLLASPAAFASKARTMGLAQGTGSYYINDQRDVIGNPANYVDYNNFAIIEWGNDDNISKDTDPEAEGGFARQSGNFVYAAYLGNDHDRSVGSIANAPTFLTERNTVDLSIAGDAGVKWGVTLAYSAQEDEAPDASVATTKRKAEGDRMEVRGGVIGANWDASLAWTLKNEATNSVNRSLNPTTITNNDTFEADAFTLSASYDWMDWSFFGQYSSYEADVKQGVQTVGTTVSSDTSTLTIGAGNTKKLSDKATMWWALSYTSSEEDFGALGSTATGNTESSGLDLHFAVEAQALSWLTARGGVKQRVLIDNRETKAAAAGATTYEDTGKGSTLVAAGVTGNFDKLMIDASVSKAMSSGTGEAGNGRTTVGMVSAHYWF